MNAVLFGLGVGFGIGAWRNLAPIEPAPARSGLVLWLLVALALAYVAGRQRRGPMPGASASASAVASAAAVGNAVVVNVLPSVPQRDTVDLLAAAPWRATPAPLPVQYRAELEHAHDGELEELEDRDPMEVLHRT